MCFSLPGNAVALFLFSIAGTLAPQRCQQLGALGIIGLMVVPLFHRWVTRLGAIPALASTKPDTPESAVPVVRRSG